MSRLAPIRVSSGVELIERTVELGRLDALALSEAPLITLTGAAGVGKSALAFAFAERHRALGEEVFVCGLADERQLSGFCASAARALGAPAAASGPGGDPVLGLARMLEASGPCIVVLDDFDKLVALAPSTLGVWMRHAPEVMFLVTSRERLRLGEEAVVDVEPLALPEPGDDPLAAPAARLFVACARRARTEYAPDAREAAAIASLVRELDGLPLAIELAAARAGVLSAVDLRGRVGQRFELLSRGRRDASARHRTLFAAIDASWDLLDQHERSVLAECAAFRGGFGVEAAEAVVETRGLAAHTVVDAIESLREKSLLRKVGPGIRFGFYSSVREYAEKKLEAIGAEGAHQRHLRYFVAFAEREATRSHGESGIDARRALDVDRDNLLLCIERALARGTTEALEQGLRLLVALDPVVGTYAPVGAHVELLDAALRQPLARGVSARVRARALESRGRQTSLAIGRAEGSERDLEDSASIGRELGDGAIEARALISLARLLAGEAQLDKAFATLDRARAIVGGNGDPGLRGQLEYTVAYAERARGRHAVARRACEEALRLCRRGHDRFGELTCSIELCLVHLEAGEAELARRALGQATAHNRAVGDRLADGFLEFLAGGIEHAELRLEQAAARYEEACIASRATGDRRSEAFAMAHAGLARLQRGDAHDAAWQIGESIPLLREAGAPQFGAMFRAISGVVQAVLGRIEEGRALADEAKREVGALDDSPVAGVVALCRAHVDQLAADRVAPTDPGAAERLRGAALLAAANARARTPPSESHPDGGPSLIDRTVHARWLVHVIERTAKDRAPRPARRLPIAVHVDGGFIELSDGRRSDFARRHVMRRLLIALVRARLDAPGRAISASELLAAGWPGEKAQPEAAQNRLYVALSRLRELGLRGVLRVDAGGYFLDPEVEIRLVDL